MNDQCRKTRAKAVTWLIEIKIFNTRDVREFAWKVPPDLNLNLNLGNDMFLLYKKNHRGECSIVIQLPSKVEKRKQQSLYRSENMLDIMEVNNREALPLLSLNHVSLICRSVWDSARFYEQVLGFVPIKRPSSFKFNGAWLYNYGIGIHLIENPSLDDFDTIVEPRPINPKDNHISFQCTDVDLVLKRLQDMGMKYVTALVEDEGNKVDQVFFHDPDGYMVELCNCENIPIIPLSSCSFKPRLSSFNKSASTKCGFMEKAMMESLSMEMWNISF